MEVFSSFQAALEKTFTSLTVFSNLDWNVTFKEYLASHEERPKDIEDFTFNFPYYLQLKSIEGDCPAYLFELAYFELAQVQLLEHRLEIPKEQGLHLNPTVTFLNLEFDITAMMNEAIKGSVQIIERHHVLCIYKDPASGLTQIEIDAPTLKILQALEQGPMPKESFQKSELLYRLIKLGLILEIS